MVEEERKYDVGPDFAVPDLSAAVPGGGRVVQLPPVTLTATYYDTDDLRLARSGASLRYRRGDAEPWTVKLPTGSVGVRHEISRPGRPGPPPAELVDLVTAVTRGAPLAPAAVLRTVRRAHELRDRDGEVLVELADDSVAVLDGRRIASRFREVEAELKNARPKLLDRVDKVLRAAGARSGAFTPKHVRALGEAASRPADLRPPGQLPDKPRAGDVVTAAVRRGVERILSSDPLVRLRATVGDSDTAVHQMRVGCRRLRSDLRTFAPLVEQGWARQLRDELSWLAGVLGAARDAEVLRDRLRRTAGADPLSPLDPASVARIDAELAARHEEALVQLDGALSGERYLRLVETLVVATREPRLAPAARGRATAVLPRLVARPWRDFAYGSRGMDGAADLSQDCADDLWHDVRIRGKRARYAVDATARAIGGPARELGAALAEVQELLGEHQDAAVAAETWVAVSRADPDDLTLAVTAGRLFERERAAIRHARAQFPRAWKAASQGRLVSWLP
jgi:CHAD domain-containing protein